MWELHDQIKSLKIEKDNLEFKSKVDRNKEYKKQVKQKLKELKLKLKQSIKNFYN